MLTQTFRKKIAKMGDQRLITIPIEYPEFNAGDLVEVTIAVIQNQNEKGEEGKVAEATQ